MSCLDCSAEPAINRKRCERHLAAMRKASSKAYKKLPPEEIRRRNLWRAYGMTIEQYDALLEKQGGGCAICGRKDTYHQRGRSGRLAVDHDHDTNRVRGLLCSHCNRGIGMLMDNPGLLRRAAEYLEVV